MLDECGNGTKVSEQLKKKKRKYSYSVMVAELKLINCVQVQRSILEPLGSSPCT